MFATIKSTVCHQIRSWSLLMSPNPNSWPSWVSVSQMKHERLTIYCYCVCWLQVLSICEENETWETNQLLLCMLITSPCSNQKYSNHDIIRLQVTFKPNLLLVSPLYFLWVQSWKMLSDVVPGRRVFLTVCELYIYLYYHVIKIYSLRCNTFLIMGISEDWFVIICLRHTISRE